MLKNISLIITLLLISSYQNKKTEEITVIYSAISCSCAQWKNVNSKENIYLEKANKNILDADKIWDGKTLPLKLKVSGTFKKEKGLPIGMKSKGSPEPARIFKYDNIEIVQYK